MNHPARKWLDQWEQIRDKTSSPVDLNTYFEQAEIAGKKLAVMDIGPCSIPSGSILVRDPLCFLNDRDAQPYFITASTGTYRTEICVVEPDEEGDCARYAAVRLRFTDAPAVRFEEALIGNEDLEELEDEGYFGFNVDAGLACICDSVLHQAFCDFSEGWHEEHPDDNLYDGYFSDLFAKNYEENPRFQRQGGDWLNWMIPGTEYHMPIFQSGFGDGAYPAYWGYDKEGGVCQLVVQFIDIGLAYTKPSDRLAIGDFEVEEGQCVGETELEEWDDLFDSEGPYLLSFDFQEMKEPVRLTEIQKAGYDFLMENAGELIFAVLKELLKQWADIQEQYGYDGQPDEERQEEIPDVTDISGFFSLLNPTGAVIYDAAKDGQTYVGITFSCSWDQEHGFGAMLCGERVVKTGGADTALLRWIAAEDCKETI